ncbi:ABC transporter ATP-binding protein [Martelella endophytica]|uniref:Sugar ABC transporter ATP-binding protein n=1 Tax=Martelella endophytica TaxID=1486262 RepID=A0A0D5LMJ0_MAREN|nr:ATP-binding cassette domain-containing protein [Martelella endophytica]AJY44533.1 sugar ABC transporter ATP-binding protein [Martelella endophytica]
MANVSLREIRKVYPNGFEAVHGIDLDVRDGEFMVFVGPSGCAKSTILRMVAGLEQISDGELKIGSATVNKLPPKQRGIGMVFQNYALYPHMKVYDNMALGLKIAHVPKAEIKQRVMHAAELLEMVNLLDRYPKQLSGGQAQRVAVGRCIVKRPEVFLFDEPLSNLDAKLRASMRVRLTELHRELRNAGQPSTAIYVTHDQVEAMTMGERICVLKEGTIQQVDVPTRLYERPANAFVAGFIGSPEMNIHTATIVGNDGSAALLLGERTLLSLPKDYAAKLSGHIGQSVRFGIRPEHIVTPESAALRRDEKAVVAEATGPVRLVEHMGNEVYVHFDLEGMPFTARVPTDDAAGLDDSIRGEAFRFRFVMEKSHVFASDDAGINLTL